MRFHILIYAVACGYALDIYQIDGRGRATDRPICQDTGSTWARISVTSISAWVQMSYIHYVLRMVGVYGKVAFGSS